MSERRDLERVAFWVLVVASLVPVWCVRYHPISDLANHLAAASIWQHMADPTWDVSHYYALDLGLNPYWGYYAPMWLLGPLVGIAVANKLVLSLYVVSLPLGMRWLLRRFDRDPALALFSFPFLWTFSLTHGFIHTCLGLGLCPGAIAAFDAYCERPCVKRGLVAFALGAAIYFCHVVPFLLYLGCAGFVGLLQRSTAWRELAWRALVLGGVLGVAALVSRFGHGKGMGADASRYQFAYDPSYLASLRELYDWSFNNCTGHEDEVLVGLLFVAWLGLRLTVRGRVTDLRALRPWACFFVAFYGYLRLPRTVVEPAYSWGIKYRIAPFTLLFLVLLVPGVIAGWRRWLLALAFVSGLGFAIDTTVHWRASMRFTAGFDEATAAIPRGKRALFVMGQPLGPDEVRQKYAQSWPSYYQAFHGGYNPWLFNDFPVRFRMHYPAPDLRQMRFDWNQQAAFYDYVVLFQLDERATFGAHLPDVKRVAREGKWTVWKLPGPRRDLPEIRLR